MLYDHEHGWCFILLAKLTIILLSRVIVTIPSHSMLSRSITEWVNTFNHSEYNFILGSDPRIRFLIHLLFQSGQMNFAPENICRMEVVIKPLIYFLCRSVFNERILEEKSRDKTEYPLPIFLKFNFWWMTFQRSVLSFKNNPSWCLNCPFFTQRWMKSCLVEYNFTLLSLSVFITPIGSQHFKCLWHYHIILFLGNH